MIIRPDVIDEKPRPGICTAIIAAEGPKRAQAKGTHWPARKTVLLDGPALSYRLTERELYRIKAVGKASAEGFTPGNDDLTARKLYRIKDAGKASVGVFHNGDVSDNSHVMRHFVPWMRRFDLHCGP